MKRGFYSLKIKSNTPRASEEPVRAIWFPSFEDEVVIENFTGILQVLSVKQFLSKYELTEKKFTPKQQRVKDGKGTGRGGY